jgi:hypothetical protein
MKNRGMLNECAALNSATRRSKPAGEGIAGAECRNGFRPLAGAEVFFLDIPFYRTADQTAEETSSHLWTRIFNDLPRLWFFGVSQKVS